jgi:hypothetical protein
MSRAWPVARAGLAVALGNLAGYGAFRAALVCTASLWRPRLAGQGLDAGIETNILLVALTAIAFAAPPVLIGAATARLAGAARLWAGLGAGLWSLGFARWWPDLPLVGPEAWVGPAALVLLSGLIGGWLMDVRADVKSANPPRSDSSA